MFVQNNNINNVFGDYSLCISEMNGSNDTKDRREELGLSYDYGVVALPVKQYF